MRFLIGVAGLCALLTACQNSTNPQNTTPEPTYQLIGTGTANDVEVWLYADKPLEAGYNIVYIKAKRGGALVNGNVRISTTMNMEMHTHSCPIIQPASKPDQYGYVTGAIVFTMAGTKDQWTVIIEAGDASTSRPASVSIPVDVAATDNVRSLQEESVTTYVVLQPPQKWNVGFNDFVVWMFSGTDPEYQPMTDVSMTMTPSMPSMGHGSSGNINPTHQGNGRYLGRVNYSMSGDWEVSLRTVLASGTTAISTFAVQVP